jgi:hypothetical protein
MVCAIIASIREDTLRQQRPAGRTQCVILLDAPSSPKQRSLLRLLIFRTHFLRMLFPSLTDFYWQVVLSSIIYLLVTM